METINKLWSPKSLSSPSCVPAGWSGSSNFTRNSLRRDKAFPYKPLLSISLDHYCYNNSNNAITWHSLELLYALTQWWERERSDLPNATHPEPHDLKSGNSEQLYKLHMLHSHQWNEGKLTTFLIKWMSYRTIVL